MSASSTNRVLALAKKAGVLRPSDLKTHGIPRHFVAVLHRSGKLNRIGRGLYALPEADVTENHDLALIAKRCPNVIVCLISALRFHQITTQLPASIWIAVHSRARRPRIRELSLEVVRFPERNLTEGIDVHTIEGVRVHITNPARTVADCFKYRNKIGRDVAVESLRDALDQHKATVQQLIHYSKLCRVTNVIRPYLELYL